MTYKEAQMSRARKNEYVEITISKRDLNTKLKKGHKVFRSQKGMHFSIRVKDKNPIESAIQKLKNQIKTLETKLNK